MSNPPSDQRKSLTSKTRPLHGHPTSSLPVKRAVSKSRRYGSITEIQGNLAIPPLPHPFYWPDKSIGFHMQSSRSNDKHGELNIFWTGYRFDPTRSKIFWVVSIFSFWNILGAADMEFLFSGPCPRQTPPGDPSTVPAGPSTTPRS